MAAVERGNRAYNVHQIDNFSNMSIQGMDQWGNDRLVLATSDCSVHVYVVEEYGDGEISSSVTQTFRKVTKRPIEALHVVANMLITLADGFITVRELETMTVLHKVQETKGATKFAINDSDENIGMCVNIKKRLLVFRWSYQSNQFLQESELALPDVAQMMVFRGVTVIVGFKREYSAIHVQNGSKRELFKTVGTPVGCPTTEGEVILSIGKRACIVRNDGQPTRAFPLNFNEAPVDIGYHFPFALAVLSKYIQVMLGDLEDGSVQAIAMRGARMISSKQNVYVATDKQVFRLVPVSLITQVDALVQSREYNTAQHLTGLIRGMNETEQAEKQRYIRTLHAYDLFVNEVYDESVKLLYQLDVDPTQVIGLLPQMLPANVVTSFDYPFEMPKFNLKNDADVKKFTTALRALKSYLTRVRADLEKAAEERAQPGPGPANAVSDSSTPRRASEFLGMDQGASAGGKGKDNDAILRSVVDTTLVKVYLHTNPELVYPFLMADNHCHMEEVESILTNHQKWRELIALYASGSQHEKALAVLKRRAEDQMSDKSVWGPQTTVDYLRKLTAAELDLIIDNSRWVFEKDPEAGLSIFMTDFPGMTDRDMEAVCAHVMETVPQLGIKYLEHAIFDRGVTIPSFHSRLATLYFDTVRTLLEQTNKGKAARKVSEETGSLGKVRAKLLSFLEESQYYRPEEMLSLFMHTELYEEKAILLSRIKQHEQALKLYVHNLGDVGLAEEYCIRYYDPEVESDRDVFLSLIRVCVHPPEGMAPLIEPAMHILNTHYESINTPEALGLLPSDTPIGALLPFFENVLESNTTTRRNNQVIKSLLKSENLQTRETLIKYRSRRVVIKENRMCPVCNKRIGNSVFAYYPNENVVHFKCCKEKNVCPVTGRNFDVNPMDLE